ncbi:MULTISPECIES: hypothetical protein [unclassified Chryseobacterium]|uniref:hypothetical protein n=1 Tax=unclassified Chryseobacterium TaxID=2593645 RepID=UPI000D38C527|nr:MULTISPECIES: hypothetical protein [unclassified Chryseobacterium]PTT75559.1 hypothetical protein DBR25_08040 [Chryseobacterium sp. HMWF001]PVV57237.1 hypothetical protein DD829_08720 [Chryseobacterium sp. HMWF035]
MEKFHKYCLSVLLVIICSNISAQISNGTAESEDCKQLYELYNRILNQGCEDLQETCTKENPVQNITINQKHPAIDLIGKIFFHKQKHNFHHDKTGTDFSEKEKHDQLLKNFEKNSRETLFAEILYFKTRVSKVRNKDYLDAVS